MLLERRSAPLLSNRAFALRMARWLAVVLAIVAVALVIGVVGYHACGQSWIDSLLSASMILSGMGPTGELAGDGAKIFASSYALFSGVVFISSIGILLTPVFHRVVHHFHVDDDA